MSWSKRVLAPDTVDTVTAEIINGGSITLYNVTTDGLETTVWLRDGTFTPEPARVELTCTTTLGRVIVVEAEAPVLRV